LTETKNIEFKLDGQTVQAQPGETVLSVARRHGIDIPALCHHEAVKPYGACRLCVVEVFWGKRSKLVTSCIYTPWQGETVETNSDRVRRTRKLVIELLLSRCPQVELLQELGHQYDVDGNRLEMGKNPSERCILCGLCVRVCDEKVGQNAISYAGRGTERVIATPFGGQAEGCIGCGACVFVCPTNALHYEDIDGRRIMKEFNTQMPLLKCRGCGEEFATEKQMEKVRQRLTLPDELVDMCPRCRGAGFRTMMEKALASK
jgi:heterodisulfide reductase subunit A